MRGIEKRKRELWRRGGRERDMEKRMSERYGKEGEEEAWRRGKGRGIEMRESERYEEVSGIEKSKSERYEEE